MKPSTLQMDSRGWFGFWGWTAIVFIVVILLVIYPIRGEIGDTILDFLNIFTDGDDLGEWLVGILVGILTGLFNFGGSIGYGWFS